MAQRRMFSLKVVDTDRFLDMPSSAQALYFHLGMRADDDGFVDSPKKITAFVGAKPDDLNLLAAKGFIIPFQSGVCVITDWKQNNFIRTDRYTATIYHEEKKLLATTETNAYTLLLPNGIPNDNQTGDNWLPQDRLDKDRLEIGEEDTLSSPAGAGDRIQYQKVIDSFNAICSELPKVQKLTDKRRRAIKAADHELGAYSFDDYFTMIAASDYLCGKVNAWRADFDWVLQRDKIAPILEGKYANRGAPNKAKHQPDYSDPSKYENITMDI